MFVGTLYHVFCAFADTKPDLPHGALAIGVCYIVSMFAFAIRAFCRLPTGSSLALKPIRMGTWATLLGGIAYGTCIAIAVTLAYVFAARPAWDSTFIKYCLFAQLATIGVCGIAMIPVGFSAGVIYSLCKRTRTKPSDAPLPRIGGF